MKLLNKLFLIPFGADLLVQYFRTDIKLYLVSLEQVQIFSLLWIVHLFLQSLVVYFWKREISYLIGYLTMYVLISFFFLILIYFFGRVGQENIKFACEQLFNQCTHYPLLLGLFYFSGGIAIKSPLP
ncbi:MAG TPA: hypothetical protein DCR46_04370 [Cytophagales bacterium]|nr:hypothetical protein [Cytophagales bacterium]